VSQVIITFLLDKNIDVAAQEVRDKVNGVLPRLPKTIQQPRVDRMDPDEIRVALRKFFQFLDQEKGIHNPKALDALR